MTSAAPVLDRRFQALGDATRRAVVQRLCEGPATVSALAKPFKMGLPAFVQHLGILEACGLVVSSKTGRVRTCRVNGAALKETEDWLGAQRALWVQRLDQLDDYLYQLKAKEKKS